LNGKSPIKTVDREYIKVYAFSLTNHKIVVTMETDTILLQPLDQLFDLMLGGQIAPDLAHKNEKIPEQINFISTKTADKLVDHSFFIVRTSNEAYPKLLERMKENPKRSFDDFLNDMYGKDHLQLDSCVYNTYVLADDECQDTAIDTMKMVHYSSCGAPWDCLTVDGDVCQELHRVWHKNRRLLDEDLHNRLPDPDSGMPNTFGYCSEEGEFEPIKIDIVNPENV
jgi:predicted CopG family antitoxin